MVHGCAVCQVRKRVRQIDCVTVKGSIGQWASSHTMSRLTPCRCPICNQPRAGSSTLRLGVTQWGPTSASTWRRWGRQRLAGPYGPRQRRGIGLAQRLQLGVLDHPDLACTWAVDQPFLDRFAEVRIALRHHGNHTVHACIYLLGFLLDRHAQWSQLKYAHNRN